jgi:uncharacterized protein
MRLEERLALLDRVVVAFSGGADSSLVAYVATKTLGSDRVLCVTAVSPSLATSEKDDCENLAKTWGLRHRFATTNELSDTNYQANDLNRCYHCKAELMDVLAPLARAENATIALGVNVDDLSDHRPGQQAARERGAVFPLLDANFTKSMVRDVSRSLGLRTWDKPAAACLASRIPHGTPVTLRALSQVERAEHALRDLGFVQLRVRHYGDCARIELEEHELVRAISQREQIVRAIRSAGYRYCTLDLEGFRSGNLSRAALEVKETDRAPGPAYGDDI